ncbi:hypothetical protein P5_0025 [Aeromonas phage P5]|nr:hypothetical protein P5_0025 [Aeromonas phage P5]
MAYLKTGGLVRKISRMYLKTGGAVHLVKSIYKKLNGVVKREALFFHSDMVIGYMEGDVSYYGYNAEAPFIFGSITDKAFITNNLTGTLYSIQKFYHERKPSVPRYAFYCWSTNSPVDSATVTLAAGDGTSISFNVSRVGDIAGRMYADITIAQSDWIVAHKGQGIIAYAIPN